MTDPGPRRRWPPRPDGRTRAAIHAAGRVVASTAAGGTWVTRAVVDGSSARLETRADRVALRELSADELAGHAAGLLGGIAAEGDYLGVVGLDLIDEVLAALATIDERIRGRGLGSLGDEVEAAFRAWSGSAAAAVDRVRALALADAMTAAVIEVVHARRALERIAAALLEEGELDADRLATLLRG